MAMVIGDAGCTTGASKELWDLLSQSGYPGEQMETESAEDYTKRSIAMKKFCYVIANLINHIKNNGQISTTVALGIPVQVVPATGTGATTGTGSGTGTIS